MIELLNRFRQRRRAQRAVTFPPGVAVLPGPLRVGRRAVVRGGITPGPKDMITISNNHSGTGCSCEGGPAHDDVIANAGRTNRQPRPAPPRDPNGPQSAYC